MASVRPIWKRGEVREDPVQISAILCHEMCQRWDIAKVDVERIPALSHGKPQSDRNVYRAGREERLKGVQDFWPVYIRDQAKMFILVPETTGGEA